MGRIILVWQEPTARQHRHDRAVVNTRRSANSQSAMMTRSLLQRATAESLTAGLSRIYSGPERCSLSPPVNKQLTSIAHVSARGSPATVHDHGHKLFAICRPRLIHRFAGPWLAKVARIIIGWRLRGGRVNWRGALPKSWGPRQICLLGS